MARYTPQAGAFGQSSALTSRTSTYVNPLFDNTAGAAEKQLSEGLMSLAKGTARMTLNEKRDAQEAERASQRETQEMLSAIRPMYETFSAQGLSQDKIIKNIVESSPKSLQAKTKKLLGEGQDLESLFGPVSAVKINESVGRQNGYKATEEILNIVTPLAPNMLLEGSLDGVTSVGDNITKLLGLPEVQEVMEAYSSDLNPLQQLHFASQIKSALAKEVPGWVEGGRKSGYAVIQGESSLVVEDSVRSSWKAEPEVTIDNAHKAADAFMFLSVDLPQEEGNKAIMEEIDTLEERLKYASKTGNMTPAQAELFAEVIYEDLRSNAYFKNQPDLMRKALDLKATLALEAETTDEELNFDERVKASKSNPLMRWARRASGGESEASRFAYIETLVDTIESAPESLSEEELALVQESGLSLDDTLGWDALSYAARNESSKAITSDIQIVEKSLKIADLEASRKVDAARRRIREGRTTAQQELNLLSEDTRSYDALAATFNDDWEKNNSLLSSVLKTQEKYFLSDDLDGNPRPFFYDSRIGWIANDEEKNGAMLNDWIVQMNAMMESGQQVTKDEVISLLGELDPNFPAVQSLERRREAEERRIQLEKDATLSAELILQQSRESRKNRTVTAEGVTDAPAVDTSTLTPEGPTYNFGEDQSYGQLFQTILSEGPIPPSFSLSEKMKARQELMKASGNTLTADEVDKLILILFDRG